MSQEDAGKFRTLLDQTDSLKKELEQKVRSGEQVTPGLLVAMGLANGLTFSEDEIKRAYDPELENRQLDSAELSQAVGGKGFRSWTSAKDYSGSFTGRGGKIAFQWSQKNMGTIMLQSSHHEPPD